MDLGVPYFQIHLRFVYQRWILLKNMNWYDIEPYSIYGNTMQECWIEFPWTTQTVSFSRCYFSQSLQISAWFAACQEQLRESPNLSKTKSLRWHEMLESDTFVESIYLPSQYFFSFCQTAKDFGVAIYSFFTAPRWVQKVRTAAQQTTYSPSKYAK
jgi:hypothetical protein